jgi:hypothetical protein
MVHRSRIEAGDRCVVFESGRSVSRSSCLPRSGRDRLAVDRLPGRVVLAREIGAAETVDTSSTDVTPPSPADRRRGSVAAFEATVPQVLRKAPTSSPTPARSSSRDRGELTFPPTILVYKELNLPARATQASRRGTCLSVQSPAVRRLITHEFRSIASRSV